MYLALTTLVVVAIFAGAIVTQRLLSPTKVHIEPARLQVVAPISRIDISQVMLPAYSLHPSPDGAPWSSTRA